MYHKPECGKEWIILLHNVMYLYNELGTKAPDIIVIIVYISVWKYMSASKSSFFGVPRQASSKTFEEKVDGGRGNAVSTSLRQAKRGERG